MYGRGAVEYESGHTLAQVRTHRQAAKHLRPAPTRASQRVVREQRPLLTRLRRRVVHMILRDAPSRSALYVCQMRFGPCRETGTVSALATHQRKSRMGGGIFLRGNQMVTT